MTPEETEENQPAPSGIAILRARFAPSFKVAQRVIFWSDLPRSAGVILGILYVVIGFISFANSGLAAGVVGIIAGLVVIVSGYGIAALVTGLAHILIASLITAINTSPAITEADKEELVSSLTSPSKP